MESFNGERGGNNVGIGGQQFFCLGVMWVCGETLIFICRKEEDMMTCISEDTSYVTSAFMTMSVIKNSITNYFLLWGSKYNF